MIEKAGGPGLADFYDEMEACAADLNVIVPDLTRRYDLTIIVSAMAEQVGGALQAMRRKKLSDDQEIALAIERLETRAFGPHPASGQGGGDDPRR